MRMHDVCGHCGLPVEVVERAHVTTAKPTPKAPADVVSIVRARLAEVESQIRDVRALEAEAETLRRMLAVVDPPAPLRAVKYHP